LSATALVCSFSEWRQAREYALWSSAEDAAAFFQLFEQFGLPQLRHWMDGHL